MTEAIIGLVGVLLGGLITGGAAYIMARRTDRAKVRAAARLLEIELQTVAQNMELVLRMAKITTFC